MIIPGVNGAKQKQYFVTRAPLQRTTTKPACKAEENSPLKVVMDRVCTVCHEMFSHENPSMRAECREDCFRTEQFKRCLAVFQPPRQVQKMLMEFY
uniref:Uncharacterized protein n=1 Tax=Acrobeloides nanus TaxID=290746 RepID=A0A914ENM7_9BILA